MLLFLLFAAANDDYFALKKLYEATGGSGWTYNKNWDMSNTNVCRNIWAWPIYSGWNDPDYTPSGEVTQVGCTQECTDGCVTGLCASVC